MDHRGRSQPAMTNLRTVSSSDLSLLQRIHDLEREVALKEQRVTALEKKQEQSDAKWSQVQFILASVLLSGFVTWLFNDSGGGLP